MFTEYYVVAHPTKPDVFGKGKIMEIKGIKWRFSIFPDLEMFMEEIPSASLKDIPSQSN